MCVALKVAVVCLVLAWLATMAQLWWVISCAIQGSDLPKAGAGERSEHLTQWDVSPLATARSAQLAKEEKDNDNG